MALIATATLDSTATSKYAQTIRTGGGHGLTADEPVHAGGADTGPAPYELLLSALGACTAITLRMYAERKGWELGDVRVELALHKSRGAGDRITRVVRFGAALTEAQRGRLAEIVEKTPVTLTIRQGAAIETTFVG